VLMKKGHSRLPKRVPYYAPQIKHYIYVYLDYRLQPIGIRVKAFHVLVLSKTLVNEVTFRIRQGV